MKIHLWMGTKKRQQSFCIIISLKTLGLYDVTFHYSEAAAGLSLQIRSITQNKTDAGFISAVCFVTSLLLLKSPFCGVLQSTGETLPRLTLDLKQIHSCTHIDLLFYSD